MNLLASQHPVSDQLAIALEKLAHDNIALTTVKNDIQILRVGQRTPNQSNSRSRIEIAKENMRILGRLLVEARSRDPIIHQAAETFLIHPSLMSWWRQTLLCLELTYLT